MNGNIADEDDVASKEVIALCRDEVKKQEKEKKELLQKIDSAVFVLRLVQQQPNLWSKRSMKELTDLAYKITGQPGKYHPGQTEEQGYGKTVCNLT